jgi:hypothetical protein
MKSKTPRRRKTETPTVTSREPDVVVRRTTAPLGPLFSQLVNALRNVAERVLDIADAAAEAVTKRL